MGDERVVVIACRQATKESSSDELEEIKAGNEAIAECRAQEDDASYSNFVSKIPFVILGDCVKCRVKHNKCRARDYGATVTRGGLRGPAADLKLGLTVSVKTFFAYARLPIRFLAVRCLLVPKWVWSWNT